jgi:hypothetical protein
MALYAFRWMWRSWREWRNSVYSLEREFALHRLGQATALGLIILLLFFAEFYIATFIVPTIPAAEVLTTPTLDLLVTPEATSTPGGALPLATSTVQTGMSGCEPDRIMLTSPKPGTEVSAVVALEGTADIPNFGFYKYEIAPVGTDNWATISAGSSPIKNGKLGEWDTTALASGDYFLQLVIIDNVGKTLEPCVIAVRVVNN